MLSQVIQCLPLVHFQRSFYSVKGRSYWSSFDYQTLKINNSIEWSLMKTCVSYLPRYYIMEFENIIIKNPPSSITTNTAAIKSGPTRILSPLIWKCYDMDPTCKKFFFYSSTSIRIFTFIFCRSWLSSISPCDVFLDCPCQNDVLMTKKSSRIRTFDVSIQLEL